MLDVRDGVGMAYMGHPFAPYLSLGVLFLAVRSTIGSPVVSPGGDPVVWVFPSLAWEGGEPPTRGGALVLTPSHAVVVGHTQATSYLIRRYSV